MRALLLVLIVLVGCSGDDEGGSQNGGGNSHYCCTLEEFCLACGCSSNETTIANAGDEAACQQLIESEDYRCAVGDEASALAECVGQTPDPGDPEDNNRCVEWGDGCSCSDERSADDVPFTGICDENGVGERGICCQGNGYCNCEPVLCGISAINGHCLCGIGVFFDSLVASCEGTAGTCCTQDTGYCYCEDGCQNRFSNRVVDSCTQSTSAATCPDGEVQVATCQ